MSAHGPTAAYGPFDVSIMTSFFRFGGLFSDDQRSGNAPTTFSSTTNGTDTSTAVDGKTSSETSSSSYDAGGRIEMKDRIVMVEQILAENDFYGILGLERTCAQNEIRRAYISRSRIIHPDKMRNSESSTQAFQKLSSAYETLSNPTRRRDYDVSGRRYHSQNSEETLSNALAQFFSEFMAGDFDNLLQIVEFLNSQNPELAINKESARRFFHQIRDVALVAGQYLNVAKFEVMRLYEIQQELRSLSYFDVLGRLRLTIQMTRVFLAIPIKMNTHVTDRQIMNQQFTNVLGGVTGFLETSENGISNLNGWVKRRSWFG
ncbi:DnaJ domain-containing protein [Syncephalis plumigaleata]|nr:DnaJ domain-containing protein [Syncephalis plumigaleata]